MTEYRRELGDSGEALAVRYLRKKGYRILEQNYICDLGEIDIVARDKDTLIICEVKTRKNLEKGHPLEAITPRKKAKIKKLGEYYWSFINEQKLYVRFDVIGIVDNEEGIKIDHIENAF